MDVKRDNIDFLAADGHKWMLSVEGLGGFYISKDVLEKNLSSHGRVGQCGERVGFHELRFHISVRCKTI